MEMWVIGLYLTWGFDCARCMGVLVNWQIEKSESIEKQMKARRKNDCNKEKETPKKKKQQERSVR